MGAAIFFVGLTLDQAGCFHSLEQRGHGVGIAAHQLRQFALSQAGILEQGTHHGELIGRDGEMRDAAAKGPVQSVPGAAEQRRQAAALGGVNGQIGGGKLFLHGAGAVILKSCSVLLGSI